MEHRSFYYVFKFIYLSIMEIKDVIEQETLPTKLWFKKLNP